MNPAPTVAVVMGSDSDLPIMVEAVRILKRFGVGHETAVISAHRTPERAASYAREAASRGIEVIIAGAGGAAHLAGVLAAHTALPVIGVPLSSSALGGVDALYATVQMPSGVPVATVAVDGARNAALLAVQMLGIKWPEFRRKMADYKGELAGKVESANELLQKIGPEEYISRSKAEEQRQGTV